jgi:uncharacterized protein (DUF1015 family)
MSLLFPFKALRPHPTTAARVASVPYDVVNTEEARTLADGQELSFLHVTRSEIDLPAETSPYDPAVYEQAVKNFEALKRDAPLVLDEEPALYAYRLRMGGHEQVGVCGCFAIDEYERGLIKKHEKTRPDKEDDRTRHITELRAQTGLVFLTYRASASVDTVVNRALRSAPLYDFTAPDGVAHTVWRIAGPDAQDLVKAFAELDALYIADGHHRAASAARAREAFGGSRGHGADRDRFIAVAFPDNQVRIQPYNRVVKDLAGHSGASFLAALKEVAEVTDGGPDPAKPGEAAMFLEGRWYRVRLPQPEAGASRADALDVEVLQRRILEPLLKVGDPRVDKRMDFVGGIRGTGELEMLVQSGRAAVAFSMFPVGVGDLMAIADAGGIMPPKSTWFEPKLRDGVLVHLIK